MEITDILIDGQDVPMTDLRNWLLGLDERITTGIDAAGLAAGLSVTYETRAELDADLAHDEDSVALVYGDAAVANNDFYIKVGASGAGSWTLTTTLQDIVAALTADGIAAAQAAEDTRNAFADDVGAAKLSGDLAKKAVAAQDTSLIARTLSNVRVTYGLLKAYNVVGTVVNAEYEIPANLPITSITGWLDGNSTLTAVLLRGRIYQRSTANAGAPGTGDDVLVAETAFFPLDEAIGMVAGQTAGLKVLLPLPEGVVITAKQGTRLAFVIEGFLIDEATEGTFSWYYATFGGGLPDDAVVGLTQATVGVWAKESATRAVRIGPGTPVASDVEAISARAYNTAPHPEIRGEPDHLFEQLRATMRRDFLAMHRFPVVATTASGGEEGLSRLLGRPAAGTFPGFGVLGVDFGLQSNVGDLIDGPTAYAEYAAGNGIEFRNNKSFNVVGGWKVEGARFEDAVITQQIAYGDLEIVDCLFDTNLGGVGPFIVDQDGDGLVTIRRSEIQGGSAATVNGTNFFIDSCYIWFAGGDCMGGGSGSAAKQYTLWNTLVRLPAATAHPDYVASAHGDVAQITNCRNLHVLGSVLYMPDGQTPFFEASDGSTVNPLRMVADTQREDVYIGGSLLIGGNSSIGFGMNANASFGRNCFVFNTVLGQEEGATAYCLFNSIDLSYKAATPAVIDFANWGFFNLYAHDGELVSLGGAMLPAVVPAGIATDGGQWLLAPGQYLIFNWDYQKLTAKARQFLFEYQAAMAVDLVRPDGTLGADMIDGGTFTQPS